MYPIAALLFNPACGDAGCLPFIVAIMTSNVSRRAVSALKPFAISLAVASLFPAASTFAAEAAEADAVVLTAGRQVQAAKDVLADNVVITADEIAKSGASSLTDLLQKQRGIEVTRNGGPGTTSSVFIRGTSNAQNVVLVDGVRIGSSTTGGATWSTIPLSQIERIEIVYGPLSSLYGADAIGGVVQVFTKKGSSAITPTASIGAGSYGLRKVEAGISGAADKNLSFALNAAHEEADGFSASTPAAGPFTYNPDKDGYKLDSVSGRLAYEWSKGQELGLNLLQSRLKAQFDAGPSYDDRSEQRLETIAVYSRNKLADNWTLKAQYAQSEDKSFTDASYGKSQINTEQDIFNLQNDITFGKDVLQLLYENRQEKVATTTAALNGKRTTDSWAASYLLKRGASLASASVRYDDSSVYGSNTTGSIAYGYRINDALRVNASYGTSFRAPTYNELYYPGFGIASNKPEKGKNAEVGIYYELGDTQLSAVYYQNKLTDLLVNVSVCPVEQATHPFGCAYNVAKATLSGLTIGGSTKFGDLSLRGSLDIQDPKDDTTGLQLVRRSKQHGNVAAEYTIAKAKVGVEATFSDKRFDDTANKKVLGGYSLLNLYATYDIAPSWSVIGRWNNVLNKDYQLARNYNSMGSNLYVGLNYGFK